MRYPTSSLLRLIPFTLENYTRTFCSNSIKSNVVSPTLSNGEEGESWRSLIEVSPLWPEEEKEARATLAGGVRVLPNFVTAAEEISLMGELEPYLKKMRYEFDHWDNAIQGYRETERSSWSGANQPLVERLRALAAAAARGAQLLPHLHVLDLAADGHIRPHVDSVRFCGDVIVGLCLLSDAVMVVTLSSEPAQSVRWVRALLPRRAAYVLSDAARYSATHAVLSQQHSTWKGRPVHKQRRVSIMCRSVPDPSRQDNAQ